MKLLEFTEKGIYCAKADVYIDPWKPVKNAIITHGHADHSRFGNTNYLCHELSKPIIAHRLGDISIETLAYGEKRVINGVEFSLHPAGHIIGSAQVRVAYKGEVWVASGDYKLENDGISTPFEPVKCNVFITECTFGLPVFNWRPQQEVFDDINNWWSKNQSEGKISLLSGYSLGKAQRIIQHVNASLGKIYTHGAIENMNEVIRNMGINLPPTERITAETTKEELSNSLVIAPPGAIGSNWTKRLQPFEVGICSGWMGIRGARKRQTVDRGFILSDHADWKGLNEAISATGAQKVICTHGYTAIFSKWLQEKGIDATIETTEFEGELAEISEQKSKEEIAE